MQQKKDLHLIALLDAQCNEVRFPNWHETKSGQSDFKRSPDSIQRDGFQQSSWPHVPLQKCWNGRIREDPWNQQSRHKGFGSRCEEGESQTNKSARHSKEGHRDCRERSREQGGFFLFHSKPNSFFLMKRSFLSATPAWQPAQLIQTWFAYFPRYHQKI